MHPYSLLQLTVLFLSSSIICWSALFLCVLIYGSFNLTPLIEQTLSFHIPCYIIFNQEKATSEKNAHMNHIKEDRAEKKHKEGVLFKMSFHEINLN